MKIRNIIIIPLLKPTKFQSIKISFVTPDKVLIFVLCLKQKIN